MKSDNKKIVNFALVLLIIAGLIVVILKGFNVSLSLRAHDTLKFVFDQKFEMNDIKQVCKDVFGEKEYQVKTVEVFSDAVYIISPTITDEEKNNLLEKLDGLYKTDEENNEVAETENAEETSTVANLEEGKDYSFYTDAKVRLRDVLKPYVKPILIASIIIVIYAGIKYRKLNNGKVYLTLFNFIIEMLEIALALISITVICRIPVQTGMLPIMIFLLLICITAKFAKYEKELDNLKNTDQK